MRRAVDVFMMVGLWAILIFALLSKGHHSLFFYGFTFVAIAFTHISFIHKECIGKRVSAYLELETQVIAHREKWRQIHFCFADLEKSWTLFCKGNTLFCGQSQESVKYVAKVLIATKMAIHELEPQWPEELSKEELKKLSKEKAKELFKALTVCKDKLDIIVGFDLLEDRSVSPYLDIAGKYGSSLKLPDDPHFDDLWSPQEWYKGPYFGVTPVVSFLEHLANLMQSAQLRLNETMSLDNTTSLTKARFALDTLTGMLPNSNTKTEGPVKILADSLSSVLENFWSQLTAIAQTGKEDPLGCSSATEELIEQINQEILYAEQIWQKELWSYLLAKGLQEVIETSGYKASWIENELNKLLLMLRNQHQLCRSNQNSQQNQASSNSLISKVALRALEILKAIAAHSQYTKLQSNSPQIKALEIAINLGDVDGIVMLFDAIKSEPVKTGPDTTKAEVDYPSGAAIDCEWFDNCLAAVISDLQDLQQNDIAAITQSIGTIFSNIEHKNDPRLLALYITKLEKAANEVPSWLEPLFANEIRQLRLSQFLCSLGSVERQRHMPSMGSNQL